MKAAIYNPYLDTLGGGERYVVSVALSFQKAGYKVDIQWPNKSIKEKLEKRFGLDLREISFVGDVKRGDGYDLCFWVSDGSVPSLRARKNFLHFQVPFQNVGGKTLINKMKFFKIDKVICNSVFTKNLIDREYGVESVVIYPPVDVSKIRAKKKENLIIYVGRFSELGQVKRQDILISAFKKFFDSGFNDWRLVIAGGVEVGAGTFLKKLKKAKEGYPIEIVESPDFKSLKDLYSRARFFWSAVGYGVNETKNPERVEHFGISLVEGMAAGAIPVIYKAGGYKEIVKEAESGFFFNKTRQLLTITKKLIEDKKTQRRVSLRAKETAQNFSNEIFEKEITKII